MSDVERLQTAVDLLREARTDVAVLTLEEAVAAQRLADEALSLAITVRRQGFLGCLLFGGAI